MAEVTLELSEAQKKVRGCFVIANDRGLHTRPSAELVKCASSFKSRVELKYHNNVVNAKSLLGILMLAATKGAKILIEAVGEDAEQAVNAILALAGDQFGMHY